MQYGLPAGHGSATIPDSGVKRKARVPAGPSEAPTTTPSSFIPHAKLYVSPGRGPRSWTKNWGVGRISEGGIARRRVERTRSPATARIRFAIVSPPAPLGAAHPPVPGERRGGRRAQARGYRVPLYAFWSGNQPAEHRTEKGRQSQLIATRVPRAPVSIAFRTSIGRATHAPRLGLSLLTTERHI